MNQIRLNSLSPLNLKEWRWQPFFDDMLELGSSAIAELIKKQKACIE